jgi:hypothetical protein
VAPRDCGTRRASGAQRPAVYVRAPEPAATLIHDAATTFDSLLTVGFGYES